MYHRIIKALYAEPWLVSPETHNALAQGLDNALANAPRFDLDKTDRVMAGRVPLALGSGFQDSEEVQGVAIRNGLAVLRVQGVLGKHLGLMEMVCGGGYDMAVLESQLVALRDRADVHTVVMIANSPGGHAIGPRDLALLAREIADEKRLVAWVDNTAASAMYYVAAGFDEIYSPPSAVIGNIGVYSVLLDRSKEFELAGKRVELFASGPLKASGIDGLPLSIEQREFFQARVDELAGPFFDFVRERRPGVDESVFDGGWYGPDEAQELGLSDGTFPSLSHLLAWLN
jgi:capsid assembly protease